MFESEPNVKPSELGVLVVDDTPENLRLLVRALSEVGYRVRAAPTGQLAIQMAHAEPPDVILLDVDMPGMDGFDVCRILRADEELRRVPILFVSAIHDSRTKMEALRAGGRDYVTKPFNIDEVLARVATHANLGRMEAKLSVTATELQRRVDDQTQEISDAQLATIVALAKLSESRDDDTGMHVERIGHMARALAAVAQRSLQAKLAIDDHFVEMIGPAAMLHDIGKVGIPDAILLKPGRLTPEEFERMKGHTLIGARTLEKVLQSYPRNELVRMGADVTRGHHERWDGGGYPDQLRGDQIPLSARIVAIVDVYDAIRSPRPYKPAGTHEAAVEVIVKGAGTHFDPTLVEAFHGASSALNYIWHEMQ